MKKIMSWLLTLTLVLSVVSIGAIGAHAAEPAGAPAWEQKSDGKIYFYADPAYWTDYSAMTCYLYERDNGELIIWGSKKGKMTDEGNNIWSFNPADQGISFDKDGHYGVIFTADWGMQTMDLIIGADCLGDMAYVVSNETTENPVDSNKRCYKAAWRNADSAKYGMPVTLTSIGNVVGDVYWSDQSAYSLFLHFLTEKSYGGIYSAVQFNGLTLEKTAKQTAAALGLSQAEYDKAIQESGIDLSYIEPGPPVPVWDTLTLRDESGVFSNASVVSVYIYSLSETFPYEWGSEKWNMTKTEDGCWTYDLQENGINLNNGSEYYAIFVADWQTQTTDLYLDMYYIGDTAVITDNQDESGAYEVEWESGSVPFGDTISFVPNDELVGDYTSVAAYIYEENDGEIFPWGSKKCKMTDNGYAWVYNLTDHGVTLEEDKTYYVIFAFDWISNTNDLPLNGHVNDTAYMTGNILSGAGTDGIRTFEATWDFVPPLPVYDWEKRDDNKIYFYADPDIFGEADSVSALFFVFAGAGGYPTEPLTVAMQKEPEDNVWSCAPDAELLTTTGGKQCAVAFVANGFGTDPIDCDTSTLGDLAIPVLLDGDSLYLAAYWCNPTEPGVTGDLDGDGEVTIQDVTLLQRYLAEFTGAGGAPLLDASNLYLADFDGDGTVSISDATAMQRAIAEL